MHLIHARMAITLSLASVIATTAVATAYSGQSLSGHASVSMARARTIAVHTVPGTLISQELETEAGGSGLRYTFDIKSAAGVREVGVDAKTGKVLENSSDSAPATNGQNGEGPEGSGD